EFGRIGTREPAVSDLLLAQLALAFQLLLGLVAIGRVSRAVEASSRTVGEIEPQDTAASRVQRASSAPLPLPRYSGRSHGLNCFGPVDLLVFHQLQKSPFQVSWHRLGASCLPFRLLVRVESELGERVIYDLHPRFVVAPNVTDELGRLIETTPFSPF